MSSIIFHKNKFTSELYSAKEIFMTGTGAEVAPQKIYFDIVRGKNKKYQRWRTKV